MTKEDKINKWVGEWYSKLRGEISKNITKGIMSDYTDDLLHHILLDLYKLPEDKLDQMIRDDKLHRYVLRGASLQLRSSTSPFYLIHRREKMNSRESGLPGSDKNIFDGVYEPYEGNDLWDCFQAEMGKLHFYQRALMEKYWIENLTLTQMYKLYNITKAHLVNDLNEAMDTIRTKCKHCL